MATTSIVALALQVHKVALFEQDNSGCVHNPKFSSTNHGQLIFVAVLIAESATTAKYSDPVDY